jgi:DNA processing protein
MIEAEYAIAVAAHALQRGGQLTQAGARELMLMWRRENVTASSIDLVLEYAGFPRSQLGTVLDEAQREIDKGVAQGIRPVPIHADTYPHVLRKISDAPPIIYVKGNVDALKHVPGVAVVGTRKASAHGLLIAERISEFLSEEGWSIVSGLALGIDAAAHEGALRGGTPTIAVLAHGLEKAQPTSNEPLAQRIIEAGGAWISEHPIGVQAIPKNFVLRNRIQVGLSAASIIVEAEEQSGSKTQADFCLRNKRTLFAVLPEPGSKVNTVSALPRMLVNVRGATPIYSRSDYPAMLDTIKRAAVNLIEPRR